MATEAEIYGDLTEIFHDVFMRDDIVLSPELTAKQVQGWDSFKQIEIVLASEENGASSSTPATSIACVASAIWQKWWGRRWPKGGSAVSLAWQANAGSAFNEQAGDTVFPLPIINDAEAMPTPCHFYFWGYRFPNPSTSRSRRCTCLIQSDITIKNTLRNDAMGAKT